MIKNNKFNAEEFLLNGRRLIEASAGTGKTYNIANLFLRLLVGDACEPKAVDQILVVTFTRAATDELRGRIREKVELALQAFRGTPCDDLFINTLLKKFANKKEAARLLNYALLRMDEACIFTIHGFAVRAMQRFLFETGALANVELTEGENLRRDRVLADLWRQLQLTKNDSLKSFVEAMELSDFSSFNRYFEKISDRAEVIPSFDVSIPVQPLENILPALNQAVDTAIKPVFDFRKKLAKRWQSVRTDFESKVTEGKSGLNTDELHELLGCIDSWLECDDTQLVIPSRNKRPYNKLNPVAKGDGETARVIADLLQHAEESQPLSVYKSGPFRALLLQYIRASLTDIDLASMQLDDVITLINQTLREDGSKAKQLRSIITRSYPVCMVDEFQDTDPAQFEMFNQLYEGSEGSAFFMIGDPKQSIYSFRGADIFSYLNVRQAVQDQQHKENTHYIFSLDTNFRSKRALVEATNALFMESKNETENTPPIFLFPGIQYSEVKSCEDKEFKQDKGIFNPGYKQLPEEPLVFIVNNSDVNNEEKWDGDSLRWKYAQDTAQRIALLLDKTHPATIKIINKPEQGLRGGDIAVLVRSAREAAVMRDALLAQTPRIGSVFQSQRDSVFSSSLVAEDIYHLLCAMDNPKDKKLLKSAMVTLLYRGFSLDFHDLDAIEEERVFENIISEFVGYQEYWSKYGVLTALEHFTRHHQLMEKIAQLPDCDRLVTDLRHLGELLQKKYLECSSREELILWYKRQLSDDSGLDEDSKRIRLESDENLVKIVTIHVSKGLEYPVVFLPFFFLPWQPKSSKRLPLYHAEPDYHPRIDFSSSGNTVEHAMKKEMLAEDMRLLYVAITRAIYQCTIGVSAAVRGRQKTPLFPDTVWSHLLDIKDVPTPDWMTIKKALQNKMGKNPSVAYQTLFDKQDIVSKPKEFEKPSVAIQTYPALVTQVSLPELQPSNWVITSYTALAHTRKDPGLQQGGADEVLSETADTLAEVVKVNDDANWAENIRYRLHGSSNTGECLHHFFEQWAQDPSLLLSNGDMHSLLQRGLRNYGLDKPEGLDITSFTDDKKEAVYHARRQQLIDWFETVLRYPLLNKELNKKLNQEANTSLRELFLSGSVLPELDFDFSIGASGNPAEIREGINRILNQLGVAGIDGISRNTLEGLMTGAIDLLFIHNKKVYLLDYKSNTLGKSPQYYDQARLSQAMKESRYDLQYLIYSVAVHRYMQQRLQQGYSYDAGEYSFGGVFYLFLRGMGLPGYPDHGVWFHRPKAEDILALDAAFNGYSTDYLKNTGNFNA